MHPDQFAALVQQVLGAHEAWRARWSAAREHPSLQIEESLLTGALAEFHARLGDTWPFFHPSYAGQMLKPPHPVAVLGYLAAQLMNPNNHALDGGPATGALEKETIVWLGRMFGWERPLGHLTGGGTMANLEALWIARCLHPGRAVAFSDQAHYTHRRMCELLGIRTVEVPSDAEGRMDVDALHRICLSDDIGTVVATLGTTALGAVDPLDAILDITASRGIRVHADAAYGGFFRLLAVEDAAEPRDDPGEVPARASQLPAGTAAAFRAAVRCDSIVIDPHKHGLQPYGCGCVLFRDPSVGVHYRHDSPYTYFTSDELHLGEISLECSRPGAAAAGLWLTLRCLPLERTRGLGPVLAACRSAALRWADRIRTSDCLSLLLEPELDIVTCFPGAVDAPASRISALSSRVLQLAMHDEREPVYLSTLRVRTALLRRRYPAVVDDTEWTVVLRSVLMKPEHEHCAGELIGRIERIVRRAQADIGG